MDPRPFDDHRRERTEASLIALLEEAQGLVFRVSFSIVRQRQDAEDVTQNVLLELLDALSKIRDAQHCRRWLHRAALHRAIDARRARRRRMERERAVTPEPTVHELDDDEREQIHVHVAALDERCRDIIVGHFFEKRTLTSIARDLGVSVTQVWKRLQEGKRRLAQDLGRAGFHDAGVVIALFLGGLEIADPTPTLPTPVLERVGRMQLATSPSLLGLGGSIMATKKLSTTTTVLVGLFCLGLGAGLTYLAGGPEKSSQAPTVSGDSEDRFRAERDDALARLARLEERLATEVSPEQPPVSVEPRVQRPSLPSVADDATLAQRLEQVHSWFQGEVESMQAARGRLEQDESATLAFMDRHERGLLAVTEGLRDAIESDPETFLRFFEEQENARFLQLLSDILGERVREGVGEWLILNREFAAIPTALSDGMLEILEHGTRPQRLAALNFVSGVVGLPSTKRERLGNLVSDTDPHVAAEALSAYHENLVLSRSEYPESMKAQVFAIIDHATDDRLLSAATYALLAIDDARSSERILELADRGVSDALLYPVSTVLEQQIRHSSSPLDARHERALRNLLGRASHPATFDSLVRSALRLETRAARDILRVALRHAPSERHQDAIRDVVESLDAGETSVTALERRLAGPSTSPGSDPAPMRDGPRPSRN